MERVLFEKEKAKKIDSLLERYGRIQRKRAWLKKDGDYICEKDTSYVCPDGEDHGTCCGCPLGDAIDSRHPKDNC